MTTVERQARIFYFSGTGNAAHVAQCVAATMQETGVTAATVNIAGLDRRALAPPEADVLLGFVSPTHGFNFPPVMLYFLFAFPRTLHGNRVLLMNTRAGMKLGRLFLPGLSGIALLFAAVVLMAKGYRIAGMRPIDMPSNYLAGRFVFAKSFYASAACSSCGACETRCPVKAIVTVQNRPFWTFRCESCMRCMNECPARACSVW